MINQLKVKYLHTIGSNYRLTEMQAAIGLEQINMLDSWLTIRRHNVIS